MEQKDRNRKIHRHSIVMTGTKLKVYGYITMLFYTIGMSVVRNGLIHVSNYTDTEFAALLKTSPDMMVLAGWASVLQLVGGLAVPVFAFLLVEGFMHTRSFYRYLMTVLAFAIISEIPYNLAMSMSLMDLDNQNPLFTLAVCLVMLYGLRLFQEKRGILYRLAQVLLVIAAILWCGICHFGFGLCTVLLAAIYYLFYDRKGMRVLMGCAISSMYVTAPISGYALWSYTGDRGWNGNKYLFYLLYPLHLLLLAGITFVIAG